MNQEEDDDIFYMSENETEEKGRRRRMTADDINIDSNLDPRNINDTLTKMEEILAGNYEIIKTIILILYQNSTLDETEFHKLNLALSIREKNKLERFKGI
jgi:hypothetical protein